MRGDGGVERRARGLRLFGDARLHVVDRLEVRLSAPRGGRLERLHSLRVRGDGRLRVRLVALERLLAVRPELLGDGFGVFVDARAKLRERRLRRRRRARDGALDVPAADLDPLDARHVLQGRLELGDFRDARLRRRLRLARELRDALVPVPRSRRRGSEKTLEPPRLLIQPRAPSARVRLLQHTQPRPMRAKPRLELVPDVVRVAVRVLRRAARGPRAVRLHVLEQRRPRRAERRIRGRRRERERHVEERNRRRRRSVVRVVVVRIVARVLVSVRSRFALGRGGGLAVAAAAVAGILPLRRGRRRHHRRAQVVEHSERGAAGRHDARPRLPRLRLIRRGRVRVTGVRGALARLRRRARLPIRRVVRRGRPRLERLFSIPLLQARPRRVAGIRGSRVSRAVFRGFGGVTGVTGAFRRLRRLIRRRRRRRLFRRRRLPRARVVRRVLPGVLASLLRRLLLLLRRRRRRSLRLLLGVREHAQAPAQSARVRFEVRPLPLRVGLGDLRGVAVVRSVFRLDRVERVSRARDGVVERGVVRRVRDGPPRVVDAALAVAVSLLVRLPERREFDVDALARAPRELAVRLEEPSDGGEEVRRAGRRRSPQFRLRVDARANASPERPRRLLPRLRDGDAPSLDRRLQSLRRRERSLRRGRIRSRVVRREVRVRRELSRRVRRRRGGRLEPRVSHRPLARLPERLVRGSVERVGVGVDAIQRVANDAVPRVVSNLEALAPPLRRGDAQRVHRAPRDRHLVPVRVVEREHLPRARDVRLERLERPALVPRERLERVAALGRVGERLRLDERDEAADVALDARVAPPRERGGPPRQLVALLLHLAGSKPSRQVRHLPLVLEPRLVQRDGFSRGEAFELGARRVRHRDERVHRVREGRLELRLRRARRGLHVAL